MRQPGLAVICVIVAWRVAAGQTPPQTPAPAPMSAEAISVPENRWVRVADAAADRARHLLGLATDNMLELSHVDRRRVHNLKYFTWVEQQGRSSEELNRQWREQRYWTDMQGQLEAVDTLITEFNLRTAHLC